MPYKLSMATSVNGPGSVLNVSHTFSVLRNLQLPDYYYLQLLDEKTEAREVNHTPKVTQLGGLSDSKAKLLCRWLPGSSYLTATLQDCLMIPIPQRQK